MAAPFGVIANRCIHTLALPPLTTLPAILPDEAPWKLQMTFCRDLCKYFKSTTSPAALNMLFLEHLMEHHSDSMHIYTDGSKAEEVTGCAAISTHATVAHRLHASTSIFSAELYAIKAALGIIET